MSIYVYHGNKARKILNLQTKRDSERGNESDRNRETERHRQRQRHKENDGDRDRKRETETERVRYVLVPLRDK